MLCAGLRGPGAGQGGDCGWGEGWPRANGVGSTPRFPDSEEGGGFLSRGAAARRPGGRAHSLPRTQTGPCSEMRRESLPQQMRAGARGTVLASGSESSGEHFPWPPATLLHTPPLQSGCALWVCVPEAGCISLRMFLYFWGSSVCVCLCIPRLRDCISGYILTSAFPSVFAVGVGVCERPLWCLCLFIAVCGSFCRCLYYFRLCVSSLCACL